MDALIPESTDTLTRFWLIRHAPIAPSSSHVINGQTDVAAEIGDIMTVANLAKVLPRKAHWYTSQLKRTRQTARALAAAVGVDANIQKMNNLCEQSFGAWEGRSWNDLDPESDPMVARFWANPAETAPPGGEAYSAVVTRVSDALGELLARHQGRNIIIVGHAGTIRAALDMALDDAMGIGLRFHIAPLSLTRLDATCIRGENPNWQIRTVNTIYNGERP
ncbi:MAG: histidine phosphatase family protein [Magnetospiraceae bacterium]